MKAHISGDYNSQNNNTMSSGQGMSCWSTFVSDELSPTLFKFENPERAVHSLNLTSTLTSKLSCSEMLSLALTQAIDVTL